MERIDTVVAVQTPERIAFRFRVAGPAVRGAAWMVDLVAQVALLSVVLVLLLLMFGLSAPDLLGGFALLLVFVVTWFYGAAWEWRFGGRTPGKWWFRIRAVRADGAPLGWEDAALRNLLRAVDLLPTLYGVGVAVSAFDPRFRRLGDLLAGTMVILDERAALVDEVRIEPPVSEAERQAMPAQLRLGPAELRVCEQLLRRAARLGPERAEQLAEELGARLQHGGGWRAETWLRTVSLAYARTVGQDR